MKKLARLGTRALLALSLALALTEGLAACDAAGPDLEADAGADGFADASEPPPVDGRESPDLAGTCYDGMNNDGDDYADCRDDDCLPDPVCCVGSERASCCRAVDPDLTFEPPEACADAPAADCDLGSSFELFGAPRFEAGGLVPIASAGHAGVALGDALDPRSTNLRLSASLELPDPTERCDDCTDVAGIALVDALPEEGQPAVIRLGLLVSGSLDEVLVLIADEIVHRAEATPGTLSLAIDLRVDGTATLQMPGESLPLEGLAPPSQLRPAVLGRTDNRAGDVRAVSVRSATLHREACDVPSALERRATAVLPASSSSWTPGRLGRVSVALGGETPRVWAAFEHEGEILMAGANASEELVGSPLEPSDPIVTGAPANVALMDPWLMVDPATPDRWLLWFAAEDADGVRRVYRAGGDRSWGRSFEWPAAPILDPADFEDVAAIDAPTVWHETSGTRRVIARVTPRQGLPGLAAFVDRGGVLELRGGSLDAAWVRRPQTDDLFAFDRDAVASPAMLFEPEVPGALWRLYYAGRRGTRWSIGLLVSEDGTAWRAMGPVLGPGGDDRFDDLGVTDPAPLRVDGSLRLYYRGTDGAQSEVGVAGPVGTFVE